MVKRNVVPISYLRKLFIVSDNKVLNIHDLSRADRLGSRQCYIVRFLYKGKRVQIQASRIIWALTYNKWPKYYLDHIDGNPQNNSIFNLRDVTPSENCLNRKVHRSGQPIGIFYNKPTKKWIARALRSVVGKGKRNLGSYNTPEEASAAFNKWAIAKMRGE